MEFVTKLRALPAQIKQEWLQIPREERDSFVTGLALLALGVVGALWAVGALKSRALGAVFLGGIRVLSRMEAMGRIRADLKTLEVERRKALLVPGIFAPMVFPWLAAYAWQERHMMAAYALFGIGLAAATAVFSIPAALRKQQVDICVHRCAAAAAFLANPLKSGY